MNQAAEGIGAAPETGDDRLAAELDRLGLRILLGARADPDREPLRPTDFLAGLAGSSDARLRSATIWVLLWRPDYASAAHAAALRLSGQARVMFRCYYTAAVLLSGRYRTRLEALRGQIVDLPDLFSVALGVHGVGRSDERLGELAARHADLSGEPINWLGTYENAASALLRFAELNALYVRRKVALNIDSHETP